MNTQIFKVLCKNIGGALEYYVVFQGNPEHEEYLSSSTNKFIDIESLADSIDKRINVAAVVNSLGGKLKENILGIQMAFHFESGAVFTAKKLNELFSSK